jgi:hypothetical protein
VQVRLLGRPLVELLQVQHCHHGVAWLLPASRAAPWLVNKKKSCEEKGPLGNKADLVIDVL